MEWYKIVRRDGNIQYANKVDGGFLLFGSGVVITEFDAISVTKIDGYPPIDFVEGYVHFEQENDTYFHCLVNKNVRWNGWYVPLVFKDELPRVLKYMNGVCETPAYLDGDNLVVKILGYDEDEVIRIPATKVNNEVVYNLGELGWCWDFVKVKPDFKDLHELPM